MPLTEAAEVSTQLFLYPPFHSNGFKTAYFQNPFNNVLLYLLAL